MLEHKDTAATSVKNEEQATIDSRNELFESIQFEWDSTSDYLELIDFAKDQIVLSEDYLDMDYDARLKMIYNLNQMKRFMFSIGKEVRR